MPIYEFECIYGCGKFEKILPKSEASTRSIRCELPISGLHNIVIAHSAEKVWSMPANIQIGKPTIVFVNPQTGAAQVATSQYDSPPPGYVKEEIKGSIERSRFEKQQNAINAIEDDIYNESIRQKREEARKHIIDDTMANMEIDAAKTENPEATRQLTKKAIEHIRNKPSLKNKRKTQFVLDVNHLDNSNLK